MFGDDFFGGGIDELFNKLAGGSNVKRNYSNNSNVLLSISGKHSKKYFVFDLSGKKVEGVTIKDDLEVNDYGEEVHNGQKVLEILLEDSKSVKYVLPKDLRKRSLKYKFTNGILEVVLEK